MIKELTKTVEPILRRSNLARNSDISLYTEICKAICPDCLNKSFLFVLEHHNELGMPNYESVGRVRRKLQELYPELRSDKQVQIEKMKKEEEYREFALAKNL